jgi:ATP/maltotriose-dependent transcriptional regulator MalT
MTPVDEALDALTSIETRAPDTLEASAWAEVARGRLNAMVGDVDGGRGLVASGRSRLAELGLALNHAGSSMEAAALEEIVGDVDGATTIRRAGYRDLAALGERGYLSTAAGRLARCLAIAGSLDEAERLVRLSEDAAATDDVYSQIALREAKALVRAARGDDVAAQALIDETVALLDGTDDCHLWATTFEDVARVHTAAGRMEAAEVALGRVIAVWERKRAGWVADIVRRRRAALATS